MLTVGQRSQPSASSAPPEILASPRAQERRLRWPVELALVAGLYVAYDSSRSLGSHTQASADRTGRDILHIERVLHISPEHTRSISCCSMCARWP